MSEEIMRKAIKSLKKDDNYFCLGNEVIIHKDHAAKLIVWFGLRALVTGNLDEYIDSMRKDIILEYNKRMSKQIGE